MKIKMSKAQWEGIGKKAGWIKIALRDSRDVIIDFDKLEFVESEKYADPNSNNTWVISYNSGTLKDQDLLTSLNKLYGNGWKFLVQLFQAGNFSAFNIKNGQKMTAEELAKVVFSEEEAFWDILRQSDEIYESERAMEKRDMEMGDNQEVGDYEKYGPDPLTPQN